MGPRGRARAGVPSAGVPGSDRLSIVATLPPHGEWRRALALDRGAGPPRRVVLSFAPAAVLDDPERLAALVRDVEAAGRLHHPGAIPVLGTETLDDQLAVVEPFRPGATLRALLDAGGRLPADVAARVVVDACAAVARAHALDAGDGRALVHGGIGPVAHRSSGRTGPPLVSGFGDGGGGAPDATTSARSPPSSSSASRASRPGDAASLLRLPGIPASLAEAVVRALAPATGRAVPGRARAGDRRRRAPRLARGRGRLRRRRPAEPGGRRRAADAGSGARRSPRRSRRTSSSSRPTRRSCRRRAPRPPVCPAAAAAVGGFVEPTFEPLPRPPATRPGADPAGVFAAPAPPAPRSRLPVAVAAVCLLAGFAGGFAAARAGAVPRRLWERPGLPVAPAPGAPAEPAARAPIRCRRSAGGDGRPRSGARARAAARDRSPAPREGRARSPPRRRSEPRRRRRRRDPRRRCAIARHAKGFLDVTAPAGAEVLLDGRRIGLGGLRVEIPTGRHHVEVRLGEAKVEEAFDLAPGETWTYAVTPTN